MSVVDQLRERYWRGAEWQLLFDELATYTNRRTELPLDAAQRATGIELVRLRVLLQDLSDLGVGTYRLGRHRRPTRLVWNFSPRSVGEAAQGKANELEAYDGGLNADPAVVARLSPGIGSLSSSILDLISSAKRDLAQAIGIRPDQIDISIRF